MSSGVRTPESNHHRNGQFRLTLPTPLLVVGGEGVLIPKFIAAHMGVVTLIPIALHLKAVKAIERGCYDVT